MHDGEPVTDRFPAAAAITIEATGVGWCRTRSRHARAISIAGWKTARAAVVRYPDSRPG